MLARWLQARGARFGDERGSAGLAAGPASRRMRGWRRRLLRDGRAYADRRPCPLANASRRDLASIAADASCRTMQSRSPRSLAPAEPPVPMHRWSINEPSSASGSRLNAEADAAIKRGEASGRGDEALQMGPRRSCHRPVYARWDDRLVAIGILSSATAGRGKHSSASGPPRACLWAEQKLARSSDRPARTYATPPTRRRRSRCDPQRSSCVGSERKGTGLAPFGNRSAIGRTSTTRNCLCSGESGRRRLIALGFSLQIIAGAVISSFLADALRRSAA